MHPNKKLQQLLILMTTSGLVTSCNEPGGPIIQTPTQLYTVSVSAMPAWCIYYPLESTDWCSSITFANGNTTDDNISGFNQIPGYRFVLNISSSSAAILGGGEVNTRPLKLIEILDVDEDPVGTEYAVPFISYDADYVEAHQDDQFKIRELAFSCAAAVDCLGLSTLVDTPLLLKFRYIGSGKVELFDWEQDTSASLY